MPLQITSGCGARGWSAAGPVRAGVASDRGGCRCGRGRRGPGRVPDDAAAGRAPRPLGASGGARRPARRAPGRSVVGVLVPAAIGPGCGLGQLGPCAATGSRPDSRCSPGRIPLPAPGRRRAGRDPVRGRGRGSGGAPGVREGRGRGAVRPCGGRAPRGRRVDHHPMGAGLHHGAACRAGRAVAVVPGVAGLARVRVDGHRNGRVDGLPGPPTRRAAVRSLPARDHRARLPGAVLLPLRGTGPGVGDRSARLDHRAPGWARGSTPNRSRTTPTPC